MKAALNLSMSQVQTTLREQGYVPLVASDDLEAELEQLRTLLQAALQIEHATIPIYLTMLYTLRDGQPWQAGEAVRSVVVEEMLHFSLAANVLNAIGGEPKIYSAEFLPDYPSFLPYKVDSVALGLLPFGRDGLEQGRLIERARYIRPEVVLKAVPEGMTIGEFYTLIESSLRAVVARYGEDAVFTGDPNRQISGAHYYYDGGGDIVEVRCLKSAIRAMQIIKDQGEGAYHGIWTGTSEVLSGYPEVAHYFRFDELLQGRLYQRGDTIDTGPTGEPVLIDWERCGYAINANNKRSDYPPGSEVLAQIDAFNARYSSLLLTLQRAFTGQPDLLLPGVVEMCSLRDDFKQIVFNPFPGDPTLHCSPTFEFVDVLAPKRQSSNEDTLNALQAAYSAGDLNAALACLAPEVIWDISGPAQVPYAGVFYGHEGFSEFWALLGQTVQIESAGFNSQLIQGDLAVGLGGEQGRVICNGAPYHYDWAVSYRFGDDHKIVAMRQYYDPTRICAALNAPAYPPSSSPTTPNDPSPQGAPMSQKKEMCAPGHPLPAVPEPFTMPFYYASLTNVGVFYLVPMSRVEPYLDGTGLIPASFDGQALVSFNFQLYAGQFSAGIKVSPDQWPTSGSSLTQELELNIVAIPKRRAEQVSQVSFEQFVLGDEQSKLMGNHRVFVPCDADVAIEAGKTLFGEPKFKTSFRVNLPSPNPVRQNTDPYQPEWEEQWGFRVDDPDNSNVAIFTCIADLTGLNKLPGNFSPITEYGTFEGDMIGCRWNILQPMDTCFLTAEQAKRVQLVYGESTHEMGKVMRELLADMPARAVRTFNSAPAAIQSRAYYP